jgi:catechol 2,3-dioxygenase-like lactoylglutathione lyase family enzyme
MLKDGRLHAAVAISDPARAREWYESKLGLTPQQEDPGGLWYQFGSEG